MANIRALKKIQAESKELNKIQTNIDIALNPIINSKIIDGVLVENVLLDPTKRNEVFHKLNRKAFGYIIVKKDRDSRIWDLQDTNPNPNATFTLACSHEAIVSIWFF